MPENLIDKYEAKVWQIGDEWTAKLLRNGIYFDSRVAFESRDAALAWAREQVEADRAAVEAEFHAERVTL